MIKIPDIPVSALMKAAGGQTAPFQHSLLSNVPPSLLNAPPGTLVNAVVTGAQGGNFTLQTPNGLLAIQTALPLQQGNTLEFQLMNPGKEFQLLLVGLNGQPVVIKPTKDSNDPKKTENQPGNTAKAFTEESLIFSLTPKTPQQPPSQPHAQETPAVKAETPSFQPGQVMQATLTTLQEDGIEALLKLVSYDAGTGKLTAASSGGTPSITPQEVKPGTVFSFRVTTVNPPMPTEGNTNTLEVQAAPNRTAAPAVTADAAAKPSVTATVIGTEKSGDTVLKTSFGTLNLDVATPLAKNTKLTLEVTAMVLPSLQVGGATQLTAQSVADGLPQLLKHWASLEESVKTVQQVNPALAAKILEAIPAPDKHFGVKLVQFIHALQNGAISEWLGQAFIKTLQQEKKTEILTQLTRDFATIRQAFAESPTTHWQTLTFPVFSEGVLHQTRMYIRHMRDEDKQKNKRENSANARFVVEVDLEKLGPVQFDGLVKHAEESRFFDLVIRSQQALQSDIVEDIVTIFTSVQEVTGLKGKVSFEHTARFPVNPSQEILPMEGEGGSILV